MILGKDQNGKKSPSDRGDVNTHNGKKKEGCVDGWWAGIVHYDRTGREKKEGKRRKGLGIDCLFLTRNEDENDARVETKRGGLRKKAESSDWICVHCDEIWSNRSEGRRRNKKRRRAEIHHLNNREKGKERKKKTRKESAGCLFFCFCRSSLSAHAPSLSLAHCGWGSCLGEIVGAFTPSKMASSRVSGRSHYPYS